MRRIVTLMVVAGACGGGGSSNDIDAPRVVDAPPPGIDSAAPPPSGVVPIEDCRGLDGVDENCELVLNASACTTVRCSKLVVVFSGGEQGCEGAGYTDVLDGYAALGDWAAVCINYFETSDGSGTVPYLDEQDRIDTALRAVMMDWGPSYWTGEHLLFEGISHGSTAPVIAMARTTLDDQAYWNGTTTTAACFFDGSYDQAATAELLRTGAAGGNPCTVPVAYQRWLDRYCGAGNSCDLATNPAAMQDSITQVLPATFAIQNWRLIECGSSLNACTGDILPAQPIQDLCSRIDAGPTHTCTFDSKPLQSHLTCHSMSWDDCRTWFEGLIP